MKKIKLLLAAMAAMVTMGVNAQSWTGNAVSEGTFFLYNVGAAKFLNVGDPNQDWGTNAYLTANFGLDITLAQISDGVYTLDTGILGNGKHHLATSLWCDGDETQWTFRAVEGETNVYQIINNGQYIMANEALDDVEMVGDPGSRTTSTYWKLVSLADFKTEMASATPASPMDVSVFIKARDFNRNDTRNSSWTHTNNGGNAVWMGAATKKDDSVDRDNKYYGHEFWNNTFNVYQDISGIPDGVYEVSCTGFGTNGTAAIYGNKRENYISTDNSTARGSKKGQKWQAIQLDNAFSTGNTTGKFIVKGGNLRVGIQRRVNKNQDWCIFDSFRLTYYGPIPDEANDVYVGIANPNPITDADWTFSSASNESDKSNNCSGFWNKTATITQELPNLPAGYYQLTAIALQRDGGDGTVRLNDLPTTIAGCGSVNDRAGANTFFNGGNGVNIVTYHLASDGAITVGLSTNSKGDHWTLYRNFELKYLGEYPIAVTSVLLGNTVIEAEGLYASLPTAAKAALKTIVDANNTSYSTGKEYSDAVDAIIPAIATARTFIEPYARFLSVKTNVLALKDQTTKFTDEGGTATTTLVNAVNAQQTIVDEAATIEAIEDAIINLRKAASTFAGAVSIVTGQYLDLTDAMLYNASMRESGSLDLWTIASNSNKEYPKYNGRCSEFWGANFDFYQIAPELPAGNYNIEVSAFHRAGTYHTYLYANSKQEPVLPITNGENSMTDAANSFDAGLYINSLKLVLDEPTNVRIGFKNEDTAEDTRSDSGEATDKWTIFRDFKIKFFGDDALAVYRDAYEEALAAAETALDNATYTNVAGTDRSNLSTAVTTTYPKSVVETEETQEKFETATANLTSITTTFKNGVTSWNNYVEAKALAFGELTYASATKKSTLDAAVAAAVNTAAEAAAQAETITTANRLYVESNALAEGVVGAVNKTNLIANPDANDGGNGWSGSFGTLSGEAFTQGDGTSGGSYFDKNGASSYGASQTIENLPAGQYLVSVTARAQTGVSNYKLNVTNSADENVSTNISAIGNNGGVFGKGFNDYTLVFEQPTTGDATISITAENASNFWLSFDRFRLVRIRLDVAMATAEDYETLNGNLAKYALGFDAGEFAPYNNSTLVQAIAAAKAIDQTDENLQESVQAASDAITGAGGIANETEVNAVYDGTFAAAVHDGAPAGWTMSNNTLGGSQHARAFVGDSRLSEFNATSSAFFIRFDGTNSDRGSLYKYGETETYTMPLKASTTYYVKADVKGWGSTGKIQRMNIGGPEGFSGQYKEVTLSNNADKDDAAPQQMLIVFTTTTAGNYTISFQCPGNDDNKHMAVVSNIELKRAAAATMAISAEAKYATFIAPFDVTVPDDVEASTIAVDAIGVDSVLTLTNVGKTISANTPVVLFKEGGLDATTFYGKDNSDQDEYTVGLLTGVYSTKAAPNGSYVLQKHDGEDAAFYRVNTSVAAPNVPANRAYLTAPAQVQVKAFFLNGGDTDAIKSVLGSIAAGKIYDLSGRKVAKMQKGNTYIVNGKKVNVK